MKVRGFSMQDFALVLVAAGVGLATVMAFLWDWRAGGAALGVLMIAAGLLTEFDEKRPPS